MIHSDGDSIATTPSPPYVAVIFTSIRTAGDDAPDDGPDAPDDGYAATAARMVELANEQPGFLGVESARERVGITVSYWATEDDARAWKAVAEHAEARRMGRERWYSNYTLRVATVTRDYGR